MTQNSAIKNKTGFACTTINPQAADLSHNLNVWKDASLGPAFISLDRKSGNSHRQSQSEWISFSRPPESDYERLCPFDSYARKNVAFISAKSEECQYIFETDDDNALKYGGQELVDTLRRPWSNIGVKNWASDKENIFRKIYSSAPDRIWARGYPVSWLESDTDVAQSPQPIDSMTPGVVQYLVDGNPDVDAMYRLVKGEGINYPANQESLPLGLYKHFHPINSQATLWNSDEFLLMYLPCYCEFRMTDIWRGYIAEKALFSKNKYVLYDHPIVCQTRNEHRISDDFFGEHEGYKQSMDVISTLKAVSVRQSDTYADILWACYEALVRAGIFSPKEMVLLKSWIEEMG